MTQIAQILMILLTVVRWIIVIQIVLSWLIAFNVVNTSNEFVRQAYIALERMTEPMYRPVRKVMPDLGALDLSPMVILLVIVIIQEVFLAPYIY
jgi:YggT family protein